MLDFTVLLRRQFFEPTEPNVEPDLWLVGAALVLLSACVTAGVIVALVF